MPDDTCEIRKCDTCGLRYPLTVGHPFGTRCPACMGKTRVILTRSLASEPVQSLPEQGARRNPVGQGIGGWSVLLDNVRSAWNAGSILRSADGFGFVHAYFCGITPTAENEAVTKTSLGAEDSVPWSYHKDAVRLAAGLKKEGFRVCALEATAPALPLDTAKNMGSQRSILVVGNEVTGVDPGLLELCDAVFQIPMQGEKRSFNVAIAFGIAAYALQ